MCRYSEYAFRDGVEKIPLSLTTQSPAYLRGVAIPAGFSAFVTLKTVQGGIYQFKGEIDLGQVRTKSGGPFYFGYSYRVMNGHALTAEEFDRHYRGMNLDFEFASVTCERACDLLTLVVEFPPKFDLNSLEFNACAEYVAAPLRGTDDDRIDLGVSREHAFETRRIGANIRQEQNRCQLTCPEPVPGIIYKLIWKFRNTPAKVTPNLVTIERCDRRQRALTRSKPAYRSSGEGSLESWPGRYWTPWRELSPRPFRSARRFI